MPRRKTQDRDGVVVQKMPDGTWQARARVTATDGRRTYKTKNGFSTEREGRAWADGAKTDFARGVETLAKADLVSVWDRYRTERMEEGKTQPATIASMQRLVDALVAGGARDMKADSFRPAVTRYFQRPNLSRTKASTGRAAVSTRRRMFSQLRALINFATEAGWMTKDPLAGFRPVGDREQDDTHRETLTIEEARRLVALWRPEDPVWVYCMLMLYAGARESEAEAVAWREYRTDSRVIDVLRGKGNKARRIIVQPELVAILDAVSAVSGPRANPVPMKVLEQPIVARVSGRLPDFPKVIRMYREAKIPVDRGEDPITKMPRKVGRHSLRHTYCAMMLATGEDGDVLRLMMGHGDADLTALYGQQVTGYMHQTRTEGWERGCFRLTPDGKVVEKGAPVRRQR